MISNDVIAFMQSNCTAPACGFYDIWASVVSSIYLEPMGIILGAPFTWNPSTLTTIQKNSNLPTNLVPFLLPRSDIKDTNNKNISVDKRPFPIVSWVLIGPDSLGIIYHVFIFINITHRNELNTNSDEMKLNHFVYFKLIIGPYGITNRNYSFFESSPIATGVLMTRSI